MNNDQAKQAIPAETKTPPPLPVAYVVKSNRDGSIGSEIAVCAWSTFDKEMEKLRAHSWIVAGVAEIVPLFEMSAYRQLSDIDRQKTKEINILVKENRALHSELMVLHKGYESEDISKIAEAHEIRIWNEAVEACSKRVYLALGADDSLKFIEGMLK